MPRTIQLENRAWRGLRVCPLEDLTKNGEKYFFELGGHAGALGKPIVISLDKSDDDTINSSAGHEAFDTFDQAIQYLEKRFDVKLEYPKNTKILRSEWTWEQNIEYAKNDNHETVKKMSPNPVILEEVVLNDISKNPQTQKELIKKYGKNLAGYTSRWDHDYGNNKTPLIKQVKDTWHITSKGKEFLNNKEASY